jgi:hypothetical protein
MSRNESIFIKWFGGIASALIIASIIGLIGMYRTSGIVSERVDANEKKIEEVKDYHNKDVGLIRDNMKEIKDNQKVIISDIKQILKQVK